MSDIKLYYFDIYGRAEPIRMLLHHSKTPFEDIRLKPDQFKKLKEEGFFEFGQVPILEKGGMRFSQSLATLRMLGKQYGYYPSDPVEAWKVDSNIQANTDLQNKYWDVQNAKGESQEKHLEGYVKDSLPKYCRVLEKRLKDNTTQRFIVGNKMTIADIDNAHVAYSYFFNEANKFHMQQADVVKDYPTLIKYYEDLKEELKDHFEKRPAPRPF